MTAPIIIKRPKLLIQPLDAAGAPVGSVVDVSCDVQAVDIAPDVSIDRVQTFCGNYPVTGDNEVTATFTIVVGPDTETNWSALVGDRVECQVFDRHDSTSYRSFETELPFDPSLYGPTDASEQTRSYDFDVPVLSDVTWGTV